MIKRISPLLFAALLVGTGLALSGCAVKGPEPEQLKTDLRAAGYYDNMLPESVRAIEKDLYAQPLQLTAVNTRKKTGGGGDSAVYDCQLVYENEILYIEAGYTITYLDGAVTSVNRLDNDRFVRLTVPSYISQVESFAYQGNDDINELVVEDGVTGIGEGAFADCAALKTVTIGADVAMMSTATFQGCTALGRVTFTGANPVAILKDCFSGCTALRDMIFPTALEFIGSYAFAGCAFDTLEFPDKVFQFSASCFSGCKTLKRVNIPANMNSIDPTSFEGCDTLSKITVSPQNTDYRMDGKNLVEIASGTVIFSVK